MNKKSLIGLICCALVFAIAATVSASPIVYKEIILGAQSKTDGYFHALEGQWATLNVKLDEAGRYAFFRNVDNSITGRSAGKFLPTTEDTYVNPLFNVVSSSLSILIGTRDGEDVSPKEKIGIKFTGKAWVFYFQYPFN
jgi:hypothetical protein